MSHRGGGFRGGFKGRDRHSPYNRPQRGWQQRHPESPAAMKEEPQERGQSQGAGTSGEAGDARKERKFSNKARLFVGNLPRDFSEEELRKLFEQHGEVQEVFLNKEKSFGFVRMVSGH